MRAIEIPASQWQCAESKLQESIVSRATTKFVRQFTYDLHLEKFCGCSAPEAANLFFKCATAQGEDICEKYLLLELRDGAAEQDGRRFNSLQYHTDPLREGILRAGLRRNSNCDHFNLIGCSNSQVQRHSYVFRLGSLEDNEKFMLSLLPGLCDLEMKKGPPKRVCVYENVCECVFMCVNVHVIVFLYTSLKETYTKRDARTERDEQLYQKLYHVVN